MSVEILANAEDTQAAFFCNTTDWAFGPVMYGLGHNSAYETADTFLKWLPDDPRVYGDGTLAAKWSDFIRCMEEREESRQPRPLQK
jgi:hypothetical protein